VETSYEVHILTHGQWILDSVYDDKIQAKYQAQYLLNDEKKVDAVRVLKETPDPDGGDPVTTTVFQEKKAPAAGSAAAEKSAVAQKGKVATATIKDAQKGTGKPALKTYLIRAAIILVGGLAGLIGVSVLMYNM